MVKSHIGVERPSVDLTMLADGRYRLEFSRDCARILREVMGRVGGGNLRQTLGSDVLWRLLSNASLEPVDGITGEIVLPDASPGQSVEVG